MNGDKNPESSGFERLAEAIEDLTEAIREGNSQESTTWFPDGSHPSVT